MMALQKVRPTALRRFFRTSIDLMSAFAPEEPPGLVGRNFCLASQFFFWECIMNETLSLILSLIAGGGLGAFFYAGLWWTVRRGLASPKPAFWFIGSLLLRTGVTLGGFYIVSDGLWQRLLLCLLGFVIARPMVTWLTRPSGKDQSELVAEAQHAPHS
jgi:F1F0 ATPase subunit 2